MPKFDPSGKDAADDGISCEAVRAYRLLLALIVIAGAMATVGLAQETDSATSDGVQPAHLRWAERLVAELTPDRNAYAWSPTYVVWDEDNNGSARNRSVCSSFVSHDLERAYGFGRSEVLKRFGTTNPQAKDYYASIVAERGFERIWQLSGVRPGDIIAIRYPAGSHPTGHVMIVASVAHPRPSTSPVVEGTTQYEAAVIDSSRSFHGLQDTRYHGKDEPGGGVGRGTLRLYASSDGRIAGYAWSTRSVSRYYGSNERKIVVGRFQPAYGGAPASPVHSKDSDEGEAPDGAHE